MHSGNINQSLMVLRNCIEILRENQKLGANKVCILFAHSCTLYRLFVNLIIYLSVLCQSVMHCWDWCEFFCGENMSSIFICASLAVIFVFFVFF